MNLGLLMGVGSPSLPTNPFATSANVEGGGFGSVFQSLMATTPTPVKDQTMGASAELTKLLGEVLSADTLEELEGIIEKLEQSEKSPIVARLLKETGWRQMISVNEKDVQKVMSHITPDEIEASSEKMPVEKEKNNETQINEAEELEDVSFEITSKIQKLDSSELEAINALLNELVMKVTAELSKEYSAEKEVPIQVIEAVLSQRATEVLKEHPLQKSTLENNTLEIVLEKLLSIISEELSEKKTTEQQVSIPVIEALLLEKNSELKQLAFLKSESNIPIEEESLTVPVEFQEKSIFGQKTVSQIVSALLAQKTSELGEIATDKQTPTISKDGIKLEAIVNSEKNTSEKTITQLQLTDLPNLQKFPSLQQLASIISENPDKLVETITNVLEEAGVTKEQLDQIVATGDIWFVLDVLQQLPPEKVQTTMEQLVPKVAVELTALLRAVELAAPKMDLFTKQVDLVKSIQPILSQFANQLEQKAIQPEVKQPVQIPPAMQHMIRFTTEQPAANTKQQDQQSKPSESVIPQSAINQTEARPVFQMTAAEKAPESRSEALMREFQAVLNRANFGQTNGMNRISIKLYPEHLGQIRIELLEVNGVMTARILASTAMAREMLDSKMHQLRQAFNQQNLQVDRIDLSQTLQESSKSDREQAFNKQNQQQKEQPAKQNEEQDENEQTFQEFMIELEE